MFEEFPDDREYRVVINHEEQYSIWPASAPLPSGWNPVPEPEVTGFADLPGPLGSKADCLRYIEEVWTDMRPLSIHKDLAAQIDSWKVEEGEP